MCHLKFNYRKYYLGHNVTSKNVTFIWYQINKLRRKIKISKRLSGIQVIPTEELNHKDVLNDIKFLGER